MQQHQSAKVFKCVVVGSTGATGSIITKLLSQNQNCELVTSVGRRAYAVPLPKLKNVIVDFDKELAAHHFAGHDSLVLTLGANVSTVGFEVC